MGPGTHRRPIGGSRAGAALAATIALATGGSALAHHGVDGEFDRGRRVTVTGMISHVDWINPHIYFTMYVKNAAGGFVKWQCETIPTAFAHKAGFNAQKLMDGGVPVAVSGYLARTDTHFMWASQLVYSDGHSVKFEDF
jgi:hypothetical protein